MDCLVLKNHLLHVRTVSSPFPRSPSSLPFFHPSAHLSSSLFISFISLFPSPPVFGNASSLSPSTALWPSFPPSPKMDCLSLFSLFSTHPCISNTHINTPQKIPLSFWLSSSAILALSSCLSLSVFSKNSINLTLLGFFTCDYLWSCCSYHFHAPDKCTEYSTQPRQEYFITDQMRRGNTCSF